MKKHIFPTEKIVNRTSKEKKNGHNGCVLWFTGLSGSGKSTISNSLELTLHKRGINTVIIDGDDVRNGLNSDLGFSSEDRMENIRRVAEIGKLFASNGTVVLSCFITPYNESRELAKNIIGNDYHEVYISTNIETCVKRDVKGLYEKVFIGEIKNMTGINDRYDVPENPDIICDGSDSSANNLDNSIKNIIKYLEDNNII